jgi:thiamine biosynthesis lipoprotein
MAGRICLLLGLWLMLGSDARAQATLNRYEFLEIRMAVPVKIVLHATNDEQAQAASKAAYDRIKELDRCLSDYDPESELMRLCTSAKPGEFQPVSDDLWHVLEKSKHYSEATGGAFDVSIGPLIRVWRAARRRKELPTAEEVATARAKVDYRQILLRAEDKHVALGLPEMRLDFGAIAKGFASDEALRVLREAGIKQALVAIAGDIATSDPPPGRAYWRVEIERVRGETDKPLVLKLANQCVSTSGDAYNFFEYGGKRYSHIVDPATGVGLTRPGSATVVARSGIDADALATSVCVLGPDNGLELIKQVPESATYMVLVGNEPGSFERFTSSGFDDYLLPE